MTKVAQCTHVAAAQTTQGINQLEVRTQKSVSSNDVGTTKRLTYMTHK